MMKVRKSTLIALFFFVYVLLLYLYIPFYLTSRIMVPAAPTIVFLPLALMLAVTWGKQHCRDEIQMVIGVASVGLLSILLSPGPEFIKEKILGLGQLMVAVFVAISIVSLIRSIDRKWLNDILLFLWLGIMIGSILEVVGVLKGVSDAFREAMLSENVFLYAADLRDETMVGWVRPKLFTSEPSHVSKAFVVFINSWLLVIPTPRRLIIAILSTVVMLGIMGSPILVISAAMSFGIVYSGQAKGRIAIVGAAIVALIFSALLVPAGSLEKVGARIGEIFSNEQSYELTSQNLRVVFPFITMVDVLGAAPIFGVGVSGKEVIGRFSSLSIDPIYALGNNVLAELFIYFGLVGTAMLIWVLRQYVRSLSKGRWSLLFLCLLAFSQTMGGIETIRFWGYMAVLMGVYAIMPQHKTQQELSQNMTRLERKGYEG